MSVKRRIERFRAPGEDDARERSWHVVRSAFEESSPERPPRRPRLTLRPVAAAAAAMAAAALVVTPAGPALADWIQDVVGSDDAAGPAPLRLPAEGRLLVNTGSGPWIVNPDGSKRLLGDYVDASWSPQGLFVTAARGRELFALEPGGRVRWQIPAARQVLSPRWAPSGFRIAYLSGPELRVVAGDGTGDRRLARLAAPTPPAWRPGGAAHVLAHANRRGRVIVTAVDTNRTLWRSAPGQPVLELAWSADGGRLVAVRDRSVDVFGRGGAALRTIPVRPLAPAPRPGSGSVVAFARQGHAFALVRRRRAALREVVLLAAERRAAPPRRVFAGPGAVGGTAWSPDGRWLLIQWDGSDQWLFVSARSSRRVRAADRIAQRFDPGANGGPQLPGRTEWCCT